MIATHLVVGTGADARPACARRSTTALWGASMTTRPAEVTCKRCLPKLPR